MFLVGVEIVRRHDHTSAVTVLYLTLTSDARGKSPSATKLRLCEQPIHIGTASYTTGAWMYMAKKIRVCSEWCPVVPSE
jgi:hypothetical protein